jgi:outer membrane cobalamin receptor
MNAYSLFNIHLSKSFKNNKVKIYLAALNILNESYQEIVTYNAPGRNYRLGVTLSL